MPGLGDLLGILEIKEMRGRPRQSEAREILERLRDQVGNRGSMLFGDLLSLACGNLALRVRPCAMGTHKYANPRIFLRVL